MKLLLFSDLHCDTEAAQRLVVRARSADVIVGAGDFGNVRRGINTCIDILKAIAKPAIHSCQQRPTSKPWQVASD